MKKECKKHGLTEFVFRSKKRHRCKKCAVEAVTKRRRKLKLMAIEYKGGCCSNCGYSKCSDALQFHHLDPTKKNFGISAAGYSNSWDKMKKELDKCILLCANCHAELHTSQ